MKRHNMFILIALTSLVSSCIFNSSDSSDKSDKKEPEVLFTQTVAADEGAVIEESGYMIEIPPGAFPKDTEITAVSIPPQNTSTEQILGGINFGPSGVTLNKPAIVEVPIELPADWEPGELVPVYEFPSNDPGLAVWNGYYAEITVKDGKFFAKSPVFHFSGNLFIRNCHSGTMEYILTEFNRRGCDSNTAIARVKEKYPDLGNISIGTEKVSDRDVQMLLGTFFEEKYTYNRGSGVPANIINQMSQLTDDGSIVVVAFAPGSWPVKGTDGLYPGVPHTAVLEKKDGRVQVRNSANIRPNKKLIDAMGGTNLVYYDWDKINEFRELQAGVGVELTCGVKPGDLASADMNPFGLEIYNPLNGKDWTDLACENPLDFLSSLLSRDWNRISGIPPRPKPWTAITIYVQKASPCDNPCEKSEELDLTSTKSGSIWLGNFEISDLEASIKLDNYIGWVGEGSANGNTFTGHKTVTDLYGYTTVTNFTVTVDTINRIVTSFNGTYVKTDSQGEERERLEISGANVELSEFNPDINSMEFEVWGADVRGKLTHVLNRVRWYNDYMKEWYSVEATLDDLSFPTQFPKTAVLSIMLLN